MKKVFLSIVAIIGFTVISNAQSIKFGLKGGVNFASLSGDSNTLGSHLNGRTGFHIGAVAQIKLLNALAVQPELLFSAQGLDGTHVNYINLPVLLKLKFAKFFSLEAGPKIGLTINNDIPRASGPKKINFGGVIGVGATYKSYFCQLRFTPGGIGKHNLGTSLVKIDSNVQNEMLQISFGYYLF